MRLWKWDITTEYYTKAGIAFAASSDDVVKMLDHKIIIDPCIEKSSYNIKELRSGDEFHVIYSHEIDKDAAEASNNIDPETKNVFLSGLSEKEKGRAYLAVLYPLVSWDNTSLIFADSVDEAIKKIRVDEIYEKLGGEWIENVDTKYVSPANQMLLIHIQSKQRYALTPNDFMPRNFKDDMKYNLNQIAMLEKGVPIVCLVQDPIFVGAKDKDTEARLELSLDVMVQKWRNMRTVMQYAATYPNPKNFASVITHCSYDNGISIFEANMGNIYICIDLHTKVDGNNYNFIYAETEDAAKLLFSEMLHEKYGADHTIEYKIINLMDALPLISESSVYTPTLNA